MKKLTDILFSGAAAAVPAVCAKVPAQETVFTSGGAEKPQTKPGKKTLVAYYSYSGNTKAVAEQIAAAAGADLFEIQTVQTYPQVYNDLTEQAQKEIRAGYKPALKTRVTDLTQYDTVFVGSPNWWGTYAPAVSAFLDGYDFTGKTVAPFFTHGGGGMQNCERDLKKQLRGVNVAAGAAFSGSTSGAPQNRLDAWMKCVALAG